MSVPGTRVVAEIETAIEVDGCAYMVREIVWNGTHLRSFDVYADGDCLTSCESLDDYPTNDDIRRLRAEARGDC